MDNLKKQALQYVDAKETEVLNISHSIWEYAELSLKEYKSAALYIKMLKEEGFSVKENLCGISTAFSGSFGHGKPVIGVLAEFDALSDLSQKAGAIEKEPVEKNGSGHGCGHNMLGAASFGAVLGIKKFLEESKQEGTVIFYGCPGEEGGASKALLARDGEWKKLDAAITWHPGDTNEVTTGTCNSCIQTIYRFHGVAAHAAGNPECGRSALDAVELLNVGVQYLREHMPSDARVHYSYLNAGGVSPNVVHPEAEVLYMIRSPKVKDTKKLEKRIDKIAEGAALMTETEMEKIFVDGCSETLTNNTIGSVLYSNMTEVPLPKYTEGEEAFAEKLQKTYEYRDEVPGIGSKHEKDYAKKVKELLGSGKKAINNVVLPLYGGDHFSPGSTDVGDVSWLTPTAQFDAASFPAGCPGHSWQNVSCGASSIGDKAVMYAAKVLCGAAVDLFSDTELLKKAQEEYKEKSAAGYDCPVPEGAQLYVIE